MKKILFITHNTSRTGAPFVLLYFIRWIRGNHPEYNIGLLSLEGGPLKDDFKEVVDQYWEFTTEKIESVNFHRVFINRIKKRLKNPLPLDRNKLNIYDQLIKANFDLVYANTVISVPIASTLKKMQPNLKILAHIHELDTVIKLNLPNFSKFIDHINCFIVPSLLVKNNLMDKYQVPTSKVNVCYEFTEKRNPIFQELKINFVVGGVGTVHWRKGSDLFIQVAKYIKSNYAETEIEFTWVGSYSPRERIILDADIHKAGLQGLVNFFNEQIEPEQKFSEFDLLLLTSREDPFPLAAIEVGMMGKPIICFSGATGTEEIIQNGGGFVVPYLDIAEMAKKIIFYYKDKSELEKDGDIAKKNFDDFTPEKICPKIFEILQKAME